LPTVLTIAGSDSSGGAGISADMRTFGAFSVWGAVAVTAVTAQNSAGVDDVLVVPSSLVGLQIESVAREMPVSAVKTGMLASAGTVEAVADALEELRLGPLVVDPVMVASSGRSLLGAGAVDRLKERLLPLCLVFTPNIPEAESILGRDIRSRRDMIDAAARLSRLGPAAVVIKGGHLGGPDSPDLLWHDGRIVWIEGARLPSSYTRGTGCAFSAAVAANLAASRSIEDACRSAKAFVTASIGASP
jgi:hydroxymethylpyrimidine/phosphomethylpyrimidine kinase